MGPAHGGECVLWLISNRFWQRGDAGGQWGRTLDLAGPAVDVAPGADLGQTGVAGTRTRRVATSAARHGVTAYVFWAVFGHCDCVGRFDLALRLTGYPRKA